MANIVNKKLFATRILPIAFIAAAIVLGWIAIRAQVGSMLAELTSPAREDALDVAMQAASYSSRDPRARWLAAVKLRQSFAPDDVDRSITLLEEATRLAPNDYRIWTELARGYEQNERYDEAERALKRSIELAPNYAIPHWQMGNFLLRSGRLDEAKTELRRATETSSGYRDQVFALAWDFFEKDPARVEELVSDTTDARANLAKFYSERGSGRDSLRIWNSLSSEDKSRYEFLGTHMAQRLYDAGFVHESLSIARDLGIAKDASGETVNNGGFEKFIGDPRETLFGWKIFRTDNKFEALTDSQIKAEGNRSLRVAFRNYSKPELYNIAQIVTVEPTKKYRLSFKLRTDNLRSGGPPFLQIAAIKTYEQIAATAPFPIGSYDWQEISLEFVVPEGVEGIEVRTMRVHCGDDCPVAGTFWYDDFQLKEL